MKRNFLVLSVLFCGLSSLSAKAEGFGSSPFSASPYHSLSPVNPASPLFVGRHTSDGGSVDRPEAKPKAEPIPYCGSDKGEVTIQFKGRGVFSSQKYTLKLSFNKNKEAFSLFKNSGLNQTLSYDATDGFIGQEFDERINEFRGHPIRKEKVYTSLWVATAERALEKARSRLRDLYSGAEVSEKSMDIQCALSILDHMRRISRE